MEEEHRDIFNHPKLPLSWMATVFIAPALTLILPEIFKSTEVSWEIRWIIALGLLSVLLFVCCIALVLKFYETWYKIQVVELNLSRSEKALSELEGKILRINERLDEHERNQISDDCETNPVTSAAP